MTETSNEQLTIEILRSGSGKSYTAKYKIPAVSQMTVLDALLYARENIDGTLALNYSCQKQRCGSCAMKIGDKISLACYTPVRDGLKIAPLPGFKVVKDLVVDWKPYERRMLDLLPSTEEISLGKKEDRKLSESASTCIRCFSCVGACPTVDVEHSTGFAGPTISVVLASFADRTEVSKDFLSTIEKANLEYCTRCYACNSVCPAGINIVACIQELQKISGSADPSAKRLNEMMRGYVF